MIFIFFFFFQAEDGIRDLVRSRGLGDVYKRQSEWMGEIYKFHGLSVGVILNTMNPDDRKHEYDCDITYGTNNEFGFDYLRDNMAIEKQNQVQRKYNYAIVDEVDSVLIDEDRTPLILSGAVDVDDQKFDEMKPKVERLVRLQSGFVAKLVADAENLSLIHISE